MLYQFDCVSSEHKRKKITSNVHLSKRQEVENIMAANHSDIVRNEQIRMRNF